MEEFLITLLALVALAIPVSIIVLIVMTVSTRRTLRRVQERLAILEGRAPAPKGEAGAEAAPVHPQPIPDTPAKPAPIAGAAPEPSSSTPWAQAPRPHLQPAPQGPTVFRADRAAALAKWLFQNWFYAIAAVSLALAGIFLVQYGIEAGVLSPTLRVVSALLFGGALIAGGEVIRRRFGDSEASATAYLPAVLAGAGLVSMMGGVVSARVLYDLIAPGVALIALAGIAFGGLLLGWLHGPLLAAIGLIGGMAAPFLVGGDSDTPEMLFAYFALLTALGLGIDTLRRWAWVSVLALGLGVGAGWLLALGGTDDSFAISFALYAAALVVAAVLIPARALWPDHAGPTLLQAVKTRQWPIFPVRLAAGAMLSAALIWVLGAHFSTLVWWNTLALTSGMAVLMIAWSRRAPGLSDLTVLPVLALLALVALPDWTADLRRTITETLTNREGETETRMLWQVTWVLLAGVLPSLAAYIRSRQGAPFAAAWAGAAALIAPLVGVALEIAWQPSEIIGTYPWALHVLGLAAGMTFAAERFARVDGADRLRVSLMALSALGCVSFALGIMLTETALTLAIAATILAAAALDRRFALPLMEWYIAAGVIGLGYRLVVDPGLDWAVDAAIPQVLLAYGGSLAALLAGLVILPAQRPRARAYLESAAWSVGGMTASLVCFRAIESWASVKGAETTHWAIGLHLAIWLGVALAQLDRLRMGGAMRWLRLGLAGVFGLMALGLLALLVTLANPLLVDEFFATNNRVLGPPLVNTLAPAFLLPALVLLAAAWRLGHLRRWLRIGFALLGGTMAVYWAALVIRHGWNGGDGVVARRGFTQPELYTYTVALLLTGALLFYQALARKSDRLRRIGVVVIGLAVAKVFLIDISGLTGLTRVFSFLLLGLSLAGLAWLNRWVQTRARRSAMPQ